MQRGEWRLLLDGELIERQMLGGFVDRAEKLGAPCGRRLARARVNQIERIALECGAGDLHGVERFLRGVQPPEFFQRRIVERLHAERDAIDAGRPIAAKARRLDAGGIGLKRDLDIGSDRPMLADGVEDRATVSGFISEGVPPPMKIVVTVRPGARCAVVAISAAKART